MKTVEHIREKRGDNVHKILTGKTDRVFERKILRKIFGPKNENGIRRIKTNQELEELIKISSEHKD